MFFLQATHESNRMMKRLARRMEREGTWDQTAYNEEQFYPAHERHATVGVSSRVMNYLCNLVRPTAGHSPPSRALGACSLDDRLPAPAALPRAHSPTRRIPAPRRRAAELEDLLPFRA